MNKLAKSSLGIILLIGVGILIFFIIKSQSSIIPPQNQTYSELKYGVGVHRSHFSTVQGQENIKNLGVTLARWDIGWYGIEKTEGYYFFSLYDSQLNDLLSTGVEPLLILDYGNTIYAKGINRVSGEPFIFNQTEFDRAKAGYAEYCYQVANHYKGKIKYYEIWNEPNGGWPTQFFNQPYQYVEVMKECYTRIKQADSSVIVVSGGLGTWDSLVDGWIKDLYKYGGKDYFDILGVHPYCQPHDPTDHSKCKNLWNLRRIHEMMVSYNDGDKEMWITEMGEPSQGCSKNWYNSSSYCNLAESRGTEEWISRCCPFGNLSWVTIPQQALHLQKMIEELKANHPYVTAFFWYDSHDDGTDIYWLENNFGLTYNNHTAKPSYYTYQKIIKGETI